MLNNELKTVFGSSFIVCHSSFFFSTSLCLRGSNLFCRLARSDERIWKRGKRPALFARHCSLFTVFGTLDPTGAGLVAYDAIRVSSPRKSIFR